MSTNADSPPPPSPHRHVLAAVEADSTVHLVRSQARSAAPAPAASAAGTSPFGAPGAEGAGAGAGAAGVNPFAEMMGGMGGGMDIGRMRQQLMSNPEMVANIMNSPMMAVCWEACACVFCVRCR